MTDKKDSNIVRVQVLQSFKGVTDANISISENSTWGSSWGPSDAGQTYLFFLMKSGSGWENPLCSPTLKQGNAAEELAFLKDKEIALNEATEPSGISGGRVWLITIAALGVSALLGYGIYRLARQRV